MEEKENAVIYNGKKYRIKEFVPNDRCKLCAIEKLGKNCGGVLKDFLSEYGLRFGMTEEELNNYRKGI